MRARTAPEPPGPLRRPSRAAGTLRVCCLDLPALPLQVLARRVRSDVTFGRGRPLAVVEEDHPQARILWVDDVAARRRVRVGMRYAAALQLARDLNAATVTDGELEAVQDELLAELWRFSPRVEVDRDRLGAFWIDPNGLGSLFGSSEAWAAEVMARVRARGLDGAVVVGFARQPTWAIARTAKGAIVVPTRAEERARAGRAPLVRLDLPAEVRDGLLALGVRTLGAFLGLDRGEVSLRFGPEAAALHALYDGVLRPPMSPAQPRVPPRVEVDVDPPDDDLARLLFAAKRALHALIREVEGQARALGRLTVELHVERGPTHRERLEPARATRDATALLELIRLRLSRVRLAGRVATLALEAEAVRLEGTQLSLFASRHRDPDAATRGIARLRAAFGPAAVTRAELREAWLPERAFRYRPVDRLRAPRREADPPPPRLVRRVLARPERLPVGPDGRPATRPAIVGLVGPYRIDGGWWGRGASRDYYYAERADGALLWLFRDRPRQAWFLQGVVD